MYIYIYIYIHTHTHTHTLYGQSLSQRPSKPALRGVLCVYVYVCVCISLYSKVLCTLHPFPTDTLVYTYIDKQTHTKHLLKIKHSLQNLFIKYRLMHPPNPPRRHTRLCRSRHAIRAAHIRARTRNPSPAKSRTCWRVFCTQNLAVTEW